MTVLEKTCIVDSVHVSEAFAASLGPRARLSAVVDSIFPPVPRRSPLKPEVPPDDASHHSISWLDGPPMALFESPGASLDGGSVPQLLDLTARRRASRASVGRLLPVGGVGARPRGSSPLHVEVFALPASASPSSLPLHGAGGVGVLSGSGAPLSVRTLTAFAAAPGLSRSEAYSPKVSVPAAVEFLLQPAEEFELYDGNPSSATYYVRSSFSYFFGLLLFCDIIRDR